MEKWKHGKVEAWKHEIWKHDAVELQELQDLYANSTCYTPQSNDYD